MEPIALMVFDMAGTTVQDDGQVPAAFGAALARYDITVTEQQLANVRGASKREAIATLVATYGGSRWHGRADEVYESFRRELRHRLAAGVRPIPGAEQTLTRLRARGIKVALTTGFDRDVGTLLLDALCWRDLADAFVCGDEVPKGRPAPYLIFRAMEVTGTESVHVVGAIGDTALDLRAGHNAGVRWNVGVLSGAHDRRRLQAETHTHLLASVADLLQLLE